MLTDHRPTNEQRPAKPSPSQGQRTTLHQTSCDSTSAVDFNNVLPSGFSSLQQPPCSPAKHPPLRGHCLDSSRRWLGEPHFPCLALHTTCICLLFHDAFPPSRPDPHSTLLTLATRADYQTQIHHRDDNHGRLYGCPHGRGGCLPLQRMWRGMSSTTDSARHQDLG